MALISMEAAIAHLKQQGVLVVSPEDPDLALKLRQASSIVLNHLKRPGEWDEDASPDDDPEFGVVQAAVLKVLGNLYRFRGDDDKAPAPISDDVAALLSPLRDPSLA